jgi:hypothetical protein
MSATKNGHLHSNIKGTEEFVHPAEQGSPPPPCSKINLSTCMDDVRVKEVA